MLTCLGHAIKLEKRRVQRIGYFLRLKLDYPFENYLNNTHFFLSLPVLNSRKTANEQTFFTSFTKIVQQITQ